MNGSDEHNLALVAGGQFVDEMNSQFYGKYPYPWPPAAFERVMDPALEAMLLSQSIGSWQHLAVSPRARIWVAGCGTNQAVTTALKFPEASVVATDLSGESLKIAAQSARSLAVTNIEFRQHSINESKFENEFDYVLCTGVLHHNAEPATSLRAIQRSLQRRGLFELMVYNKYHRTWTTAFQKITQILTSSTSTPDFDAQMDVTKRLMSEHVGGSMGAFVEQLKLLEEAAVADQCLQPVERSYTVESLRLLLGDSAFQYCAPCVNQFDRVSGQFLWNVQFIDAELRNRYEDLPDAQRWQVANLLLLERSPMLWFYVQRTDCGREIKSERLLCSEFLARTFKRVIRSKSVFLKTVSGSYERSAKTPAYPPVHPDPLCRAILGEVDTIAEPIGKILDKLGIVSDFYTVNRLRLMLTTCAYPYLICTQMEC